MRVVERELLGRCLRDLGEHATRCRQRAPDCAERFMAWLEENETRLGRPLPALAGLMSAERATVASAGDTDENGSRRRRRALVRVAIAEALDRIQGTARARLERVEAELESAREPLARALGQMAVRKPALLEPGPVDEQRTALTWSILMNQPDLAPLMRYLAVRLTVGDRRALLAELLVNGVG